MDFVTHLPRTPQRHDAVWVIVDRLTKSTHFLAVQMTFSLERFCRLYIRETLQEIHSLPTKITNGLNSVGNYRRNIDGTKHIIFSKFLLPFTDRIHTKNYRRKCSVGNFRAVCRRQLLGTIYRQNTYGKLPTEVFRR